MEFYKKWKILECVMKIFWNFRDKMLWTIFFKLMLCSMSWSVTSQRGENGENKHQQIIDFLSPKMKNGFLIYLQILF